MLLNKETKQITAYLMYMPKSQWGIKDFMRRLILLKFDMLLNKETKPITAYLMYMPKGQWGIKDVMRRLILLKFDMLLNKETKPITAYLMYMPKGQWWIKDFMRRLILLKFDMLLNKETKPITALKKISGSLPLLQFVICTLLFVSRKDARAYFLMCTRGLVDQMIDCDIEVSEFELHSGSYFRINTLIKDMNPMIQ